jgi:hypothetical protein
MLRVITSLLHTAAALIHTVALAVNTHIILSAVATTVTQV